MTRGAVTLPSTFLLCLQMSFSAHEARDEFERLAGMECCYTSSHITFVMGRVTAEAEYLITYTALGLPIMGL